MPQKNQHKGTKRRYKRVAAALAGAAMMSSLLPGIPFSRVYAAANPNVTYRAVARDQSDAENMTAGSPVQVVKDNAGTFGFNTDADQFTLLSQSESKATVQVRKDGQTFKVDLVQEDGNWIIKTIRGIGDMTHPATYTPASMFYYRLAAAPPASESADSQTIYQTDNFSQWSWNQAAYPADMGLGVLLQNPNLTENATAIPDNILSQITNIDFSRHFVLFANLGSVAAKGYGIGIEKVVQTGNDFTVTVRTKSPAANETLTDTKRDDLVLIDRATLDFSNPILINFVDQNGTRLITYELTLR